MVWEKGTILQNGKYQIDRVLGQGGFGITYKATLLTLGSPVVIKAPHGDLLSTDDKYEAYVKLFIKEGKSLETILKTCPSIHLIQVREWFTEDDMPCMVMNFIEGETIFEWVKRRGPIPEKEIVSCIAKIAQVLVTVHKAGLSHRDAQPANIMIKPDGQPVLIDFGIAHEIQPLSKTTVCAGGHMTFAPYEQLRKKSKSPQVDVYCLAATLYYAITGKPPQDTYDRAEKDELIPPKKLNPKISDRTNKAILAGLEFHPGNRPATMQDWLYILVGDRSPQYLTRRRMLQYGGIAAGGFAFAYTSDRAIKAFMPEPLFLPAPNPPKLADLKFKEQSFKTVLLNEVGKISSQSEKTARAYEEDLGNGVVLRMMLIPGGTFQMGSPKDELLRSNDEGPVHEVKVPDFLMGEVQITQAQWKAVATQLPEIRRKLNPSPSFFSQDGNDRPVERVSWIEALEFCDRLAKKTNKPYRLPSEAQWEYACRAGMTTPFHFGPTITTDVANYRGTDDRQGGNTFPGNYGKGPKGEYRGATTSAKSFKISNEYGLYDMHGNVWEWCLDNWHQNYEKAPIDGSAWLDQKADVNSDRVLRGGSYNVSPRNCRSAIRFASTPGGRDLAVGFRVMFPLSPRTL